MKGDILLENVDLDHPDTQLLLAEFKYLKIGTKKLRFKVIKK